MEEVAEGIWRWAARHPAWHPRTAFGAEVASFAMRDGRGTLVVDPVAPGGDPAALVAALEPIVRGRLRIVITIPYHVRDAEPLWRHHRTRRDATIWGHPAAAKRLRETSGFRAIQPGVDLDGGIRPIAIGNPRRYETPLYVPRHRALVFGDTVVEDGGALRVWIQRELTPERGEWYRTRLRPSLDPLLDVEADRVLVTHGRPVLSGGRDALRGALDAGPWYHAPH